METCKDLTDATDLSVKRQPGIRDYCPISLLFHLGKLSEDAILNKMKKQVS